MPKTQQTLSISLQPTDKNALRQLAANARIIGRNKQPSLSEVVRRIAVAYQHDRARVLTIMAEIDGIYQEAEVG